MTIPYASATSWAKAREEIIKILKRFGCENVGFMDEFNSRSLLLAFSWRGKNVQLRASAQGWANAWLRENPHSNKMRLNRAQHEEKAINQGLVAINSILRDWVKGQVTAIETGILTFEHVFLPHMLSSDGRPVAELMGKLLIGERE